MIKKFLAGLLTAAVAVSSLPAGLSFSSAAADPSVRLEYSFNGASLSASDSSGNGRDGRIFGTAELSDDAVEGQSLLLKGGYVHMPDDIVEGCADLTVSVWTKPLRSQNDSRLWDIGSNDQNFLNLFAPLAGNKYASALRINNSAARAESANDCFTANEWQQVTVTFEQSTGLLKIYKNGSEIAKISTGDRRVSQLGKVTNATIGRAQFPKDPDYYGLVDNFVIYDKAMTAEQAAQLYSSERSQLLQTKADSIDIAALNGIKTLDGIEQDLTLPTAQDFKDAGFSVGFKSSDGDIIADDGRLGAKTGDVTLTAQISDADVSVTREFKLTVKNDPVVPDPVPDVTTVPGRFPELPEKITANGGKVSLLAEWDELSADDYAFPKALTVNGKAANGAEISVKVNISDKYMTNQIIEQGSAGGSPDPYVAHYNGYYYYVRHNYNTGITVSKAKRLSDIESAPRKVVYNAPASGAYSKEYWAPEIFFIDGDWYIYVAADDGNNANHRMYCLKSTDPNDAQAPYEMQGLVAPTAYSEASQKWEIKQDENKWAIDGTVLENVNGKNYFIWSGWEGDTDGQQNIYIAEMLNPYTLKGSRVLLNTPSAPWERKQLDGDCLVNEGPQIVKHGDKIHILYSANHSGRDLYCIGALTMNADSDPLSPASWTKSDGPLFTQSLDPADKTYGTGHAMITESPDKTEQYLIYHAFRTSGGGWVDRSARAVLVSWDGDYPVFNNPVAPETLIKAPSGTDDGVIAGKYEAEAAKLSGGAVKTPLKRPSGGYVVSGIGKKAAVEFEITAERAGEYLISFMGNSRISGGKCYQDVTVNDTKYKIEHSGVNNDQGIWRPSSDANSKNGDGLYAYLKKGKNTISVTQSADSSGTADLDYLKLVYLENSSTGITLSETELTLDIGDSAQLAASVLPENAEHRDVVFASSDENVVSVDRSGKVTAVSAGSATVTASPYNNSGVYAECKITVRPIEVSAITLSKTSAALTVGETLTLTAAVLPENASFKAVSWSSSDQKIATVDRNGRVTAVSAGSAVISAKASNGVSAQCKIKVGPKAVASLRISATKATLTAGRKKQLSATVAPVSAARVVWSSSNAKTVSVSASGVITAKKAGTAVITAAAGNKTAKCIVTVKPAKATRLKLVRVGGKLNIRFKKGLGAAKSKIVIYKNGKKLKTATVSGASYKFKAAKGKYKVKITCFAKVNKKTYQSAAAALTKKI